LWRRPWPRLGCGAKERRNKPTYTNIMSTLQKNYQNLKTHIGSGP
jgi:hypothetical protein